MPSYICKQPNGRYARFTSVCDDFTHLNLTADQMLRVLEQEGLTREEASGKVIRANNDERAECYDPENWPKGLVRWYSALEVVAHVHGERVALRRASYDTSNLKDSRFERDEVQRKDEDILYHQLTLDADDKNLPANIRDYLAQHLCVDHTVFEVRDHQDFAPEHRALVAFLLEHGAKPGSHVIINLGGG